jgi:hypothetical protein
MQVKLVLAHTPLTFYSELFVKLRNTLVLNTLGLDQYIIGKMQLKTVRKNAPTLIE